MIVHVIKHLWSITGLVPSHTRQRSIKRNFHDVYALRFVRFPLDLWVGR